MSHRNSVRTTRSGKYGNLITFLYHLSTDCIKCINVILIVQNACLKEATHAQILIQTTYSFQSMPFLALRQNLLWIIAYYNLENSSLAMWLLLSLPCLTNLSRMKDALNKLRTQNWRLNPDIKKPLVINSFTNPSTGIWAEIMSIVR